MLREQIAKGDGWIAGKGKALLPMATGNSQKITAFGVLQYISYWGNRTTRTLYTGNSG